MIDGGSDGLTITLTTDALTVGTSTEAVTGLAASYAAVTRLRLGMEGTLPLRLDNGSKLTPTLGAGVRYDLDDAVTGFGADLSAGLAWHDVRNGLSAEFRGRGFLTGVANELGLRDIGVSAMLSWDPVAGEQGPRASLTQALGGASAGGVDALLQRATLGAPAGNGEFADPRTEVGIGYGFTALEDRVTWTPEASVGLSDDSREYGLEFHLEGTRAESTTGESPAVH